MTLPYLEQDAEAGDDQDITSLLACGTYTLTRDAEITCAFSISSLTATAATIEARLVKTSAGDAEIAAMEFSRAKPDAADVTFGDQFKPFLGHSGEKFVLYLKSSNAGDTTVSYITDWADAFAKDAVMVSGDKVAADNAELQFDGTGLSGATYPASQAQVDGIGTAGGAAISTDVNDDNYDGGIAGITSGTTKVGTQTNTYASTSVLDGTAHIMTHAAQSVDIVYQFLCGGGTSPVGIVWTGLMNPINDTLTFSAWNHVGGAWEVIGTLAGQTSTTIMKVKNIVLYARHMGTSAAELGKVYLRLNSSAAYNHILRTDQVYTTYSITARTVGYAKGAVWVDTVNGTAGTESFVHGIADNPSLTWANALTIAAAVGLERFEIVNGSTITLNANSDNYTLGGEAWTLALGTQSCSGTSFAGATAVSGVCTGANPPQFHRCIFNSATVPPSHFYECGFNGTLTFGSAGEYTFDRCHSSVGGTSAPVFDFGTGNNASEVNMRAYSGGMDIRYMGAGTGSYDMSLEGNGQLIVNANCSATSTIAIRGNFTISGDSTAIAAITFSDDARYDVDQINAECDSALSDWGKTGFGLASTGLDSIATTEPTGVATTFAGMMVQLWRRFFKKSTLTSTELKTYKDDTSTVVTTQTVSDDGTTQTQDVSS